MSVLGLNSKDRKSTRDKANISNPKVNRGCAPLTANIKIYGIEGPYIPLGVCHTGGSNAMLSTRHSISWYFIKVTSQWTRWRLKSPASRLYTQPFVQTQIKKNIKTPRHWPFSVEIPKLINWILIDVPLRWRHNGWDSVSNHQPRECLLRRVIRRTSKKTSKLRVTGLCAGNSFPVIYSVMCFTEDWRYQFTLASDVCFLELI